jgi:methionine-rich copper-binding protein CopC
MTRSKWWTGGVALLLAASAQAHTHLKSATPAEGSTVKSAEQITLNFSEKATVTALTLQKEGGDERKLTPPADGATDHVTVAAGKLEPGKYTLNWRVVSDDKHVMSGKLHFTVSG